MTEWIDVPGYHNRYAVNQIGQVKSHPRTGTRGGILKPDLNRNGYLQVRLYHPNGSRVFYIHRLIAWVFLGKSRLHVNHKNGNRLDNRIENLEYVTPKQNTNHALKARGGWFVSGEKHGMSKLTSEQVDTIKILCNKHTQREVSKMFGISEAQVSRILNGQRWNK